MKDKKYNLGFTLVELTTVIAIIAIIFLITLANYRSGEKYYNLQLAAHRLAQDIRRVQSMAMESQVLEDQTTADYGLYFNLDYPGEYVIFADVDGDGLYDPNQEDIEIEKVSFEDWIGDVGAFSKKARIVIINLSGGDAVSDLHIAFSPPDPNILIMGEKENSLATITLAYDTFSFVRPDESPVRTITMNKVGLVDIIKELP